MIPHAQPSALPSRAAPPAARLRAGCAAGAVLGALATGPAAAEITAQEARDAFETSNERFGTQVEVGSEEASEGTVTLSDVVLSFEADAPEEADAGASEGAADDMRIEATIDRMTFEERPAGGVRVTLSPESPMTVRGTDPETGEPYALDLRLLTEGFELLLFETESKAAAATESEAPWRYEYRADRLGAVLVEGSAAGEPIEGEGEFVMTGLSGAGTMVSDAGPSGEVTRYAESAEMAELALRASFPIPEEEGRAPSEGSAGAEGGRLDLTYEAEDLTLTTQAMLPDGGDLAVLTTQDDPQALLESGLALSLAVANGGTTFELAATGGADSEGTLTVEGGSEAGHVRYAFDAQRMEVGGATEGLRYDVETAGLPTGRVEVALDSGEAEIAFPIGVTDEARPFTLRYDLSGLTLNEEVWALVDPEGRLPRDPASLLVAFEGRVRLLAHLFDEEAQAEAEEAGEIPAEFEEASVEIDLDAVGAGVEATGDFTFDDEDTSTFPGMPAPTGTIVIDASGVDALLDTLVEMGLVAPDQLTPARLMLGLFARPDDEGGYTSEIAIDGATGEVTANGQRLR